MEGRGKKKKYEYKSAAKAPVMKKGVKSNNEEKRTINAKWF
jgi:hypothetical protein